LRPSRKSVVATIIAAALVASTAAQANPVTVVAAGDIACQEDIQFFSATTCHHRETADLALSLNPRIVLVLGDNQYQRGELGHYNKFYDPSWGRMRSITFPTPGNHEYYTPGAAGYFDYFGARAGPQRRGYYASEQGAWLIVSLNSEIGTRKETPQNAWLRNLLRANNRRCILAFWHKPLFSSGERSARTRPLWRVLYRRRADIVLSGHAHDYERFSRQSPNGDATARGIREFVVGTGGRSLTPFVKMAAHSRYRTATNFGVLKLELYARGYTWMFMNEASTVLDSGHTACH
jgi:3',5'-cyclic AMP phosphodiesterase CpdA